MQSFYTEAAQRQEQSEDKIGALSGAISRLAERLETGGDSAEGDSSARIAEALEKLASDGNGQFDAESRMRLRSMDVQMLRILEEISAGRQEAIGELRTDLTNLTNAVRMIGRGG